MQQLKTVQRIFSIDTEEPQLTTNAGGDKVTLVKIARTHNRNTGNVVDLMKYASLVETSFTAKLAVLGADRQFDEGAVGLLLAVLASKEISLLTKAFPRACFNVRTVCKFVEYIRSGIAGRKSLGTVPKRLVQSFLNSRTDWELLSANFTMPASIADVIKNAHPKPADASRKALYGLILGRNIDESDLSDIAQKVTTWKRVSKAKPPSESRVEDELVARRGETDADHMVSLVNQIEL